MSRLSVCIPVKNYACVEIDGRMTYPLPNCIRALVTALAPGFDAQIVIADFDSDDWPLDDWVHIMARPVPVQVVCAYGAFSVGKGFNIAADYATSDRLLFLGADMLVSRALIEKGHALLDKGIIYFPLVWSYTNPEHTEGRDRPFGRGNVFMTKAMRETLGPWREFKSHGKSDCLMFHRAEKKCKVLCERGPDFFHQWHPDDMEWKNRHYPPGWEADKKAKEAAYKAHKL